MRMQLRNQLDSIFIKAILLGGFLLSLFLSSPVRAEGGVQIIQSLQPITISSGGASLIPSAILVSLAQGSTSPVAQYILTNHLMNNAIQDNLNHPIADRDPYVVAKKKYDEALCKLSKTFQSALVLSIVPQTSSIVQYGGSNDAAVRQAKLAQAVAMAQEFAETPGCNEANPDDSGFDRNLLAFLQSLGG